MKKEILNYIDITLRREEAYQLRGKTKAVLVLNLEKKLKTLNITTNIYQISNAFSFSNDLP